MQTKIQKITPFLWFDDQAEEAVKFYTSIFKNSKMHKITRYDEESSKAAGKPKGTAMTVEFELEGQRRMPRRDTCFRTSCSLCLFASRC